MVNNRTLFVDSGAHSLYNYWSRNWAEQAGYEGLRGERHKYSLYETKEFWQYVDDYAAFIKQHEKEIDVYVNVDVIFNPKMTWEVQQYLEKEHGLHPLPVVHYGTPLKWLEHYVKKGYDYIGIGGLGQEVTVQNFYQFGDSVFDMICDRHGKPQVKTHGFAMTAIPLLARYPWYSVDSSSWLVFGRYGFILVPPIDRSGKTLHIQQIYVSEHAKLMQQKHAKNQYAFESLPPIAKDYVLRYLEELGVKWGVSKFFWKPLDDTSYKCERGKSRYIFVDEKKGTGLIEEVIVEGVSNKAQVREAVNIQYFLWLQSVLPSWEDARWDRGKKTSEASFNLF